jgi:hypothetical protein
LTAYFCDLDIAVTFGEGPERRTGFNGLKPLGNQNDLGAGPFGFPRHPFQMA